MSRLKTFVVCATLCLSCAGVAGALDASEIIQLSQGGVQDTVIINMVRSQKLAKPLSTQDVINMSAAGISPELLEQLTRPENVSSSYVAPSASSPAIVTSPAPSVTYVEPAPATVVQPQPSVVVTSPPTVYYNPPPTDYYPSSPTYVYPTRPYYYHPYRPRPNIYFNFSHGGRRDYHRWRR